MKMAHARHIYLTGAPRRIGAPHQRGAIGILGAITLLLSFAFLALAVDTGRLWLERRNLQKMADLAAMAAVRYTGCGGSADLIRSKALETVRNNGLASALADGSASITTTYGTLSADPQKVTIYTPSNSASTLGTYATRVSLTRQIPTSIVLGGMFTAPLTITAAATAKGGAPIVTFTQNAQVFSFDVFNKLWQNALKKAPPSPALLNTVGAVNVSLQALVTAAGYSTVDELLNSSMTLQDLLDKYSAAVALGQADQATTDSLKSLIGIVGPGGLSMPLSQILTISSGDKDALLSADINLLGLLQTSVKILGKDSAIDLGLSAGDIAGVRIKMGDIPPLAIGPGGLVDPTHPATSAKCTSLFSQEVTLAVKVSPTKSSSILAPIFAILGKLVDITADLEVGFHFGNATTSVDYIEPVSGTATVHFNTETSFARITYTKTDQPDNVPGEFSVKLLGATIVGITIGTPPSTDNKAPFIGSSMAIDVPTPIHENQNLPQSKAGSSELSGTIHGLLQSIPEVKLNVIGFKINVTAIANAITSVVGAFLEPILASTIDPLLKGLGINIGAGQITIYNIQNLQPQLVQ